MLDVSLRDLLGGLDAPAGEDLIGIVAIVMVVMMTAAAVAVLIMMMFVLLLIMVVMVMAAMIVIVVIILVVLSAPTVREKLEALKKRHRTEEKKEAGTHAE